MLRTAKKGFTLIELLIVVVIIGILAAIAIPKFANTKQKAYVAAMKSDLRNLVTAEEAYFSNAQTYSTTANLISGSSFKPSANVTLTDIGSPTATGWGAQASHSGVPGQTCWIQIGSGATTEGTPNC